MFSIIIPSYNKLDFIERTIQSVLKQTFTNFELIIIDDGSTDGSIELLKKIQNNTESIKIIFQDNAGVSKTRNFGASVAKYPYLTFLDADDWWEPHFLEEMKNLISNYPEAGLYSSNFFKVKNGRKYSSDLKFPNGFESGYIDYFKSYISGYRQPIFPSTAIISRNAFDYIGGFHPLIARGEDFYFWTSIALHFKIAYLNKNLSNYNQDSDINFRATKKIHNIKADFVYYVRDFKEFEKNNPYLKMLLDKIRLNTFKRSLTSNSQGVAPNLFLDDIDFSGKYFIFRLWYHLPRPFLRFIYSNNSKLINFKHYIIKFLK